MKLTSEDVGKWILEKETERKGRIKMYDNTLFFAHVVFGDENDKQMMTEHSWKTLASEKVPYYSITFI